MFLKKKILKLTALIGGLTLAGVTPAAAEVSSETQYILNSFSFLVNGFLVMFMAAGFAMLEAGLVRTKNTSMQLLKNVGLYSVAGIMFYLCGYNLMYDGVDGGYVGSFTLWGADDVAATGGDFSAGYSASSDWFFQMVFVATAASIVSGTVAERIKLWPFMIFVLVLTGFIYPITGSWEWGAGWLDAKGFADFAGSTLVHSVGGWAALSGALILGARKGKYDKEGRVSPIPGSNLPLAALGTFILWMGWFGFNGGSQLAIGSAADIIGMANVFVNTNMAAAGGVVSAMLFMQLVYKKIDLTMVLNGALAGLVSITAGPDTPSIALSVGIGAVGGVLSCLTVPVLDKFKIDDVVGAIPVHLVCGIFGTLVVPLSNADTSFVTQLTGVLAVAGFVLATSTIVWMALKYTVGIRVSEEEETAGLDRQELGVEAYPEFGGSQSLIG